MAINTCQNSKCAKDFKSRQLVKKFCCHGCYIQHKLDNPSLYSEGKFKEGQASWNKGKKFTKIGDFMIRKETLKSGNVKSLRFINVGDGNGGIKYIRNDRYVWEQVNGPIPANYVIYHKDGRSLNDDFDNLECITFSEALSRYRALREEVYDLSDKKDAAKIVKGCLVNDKRMQKLLFEMTYNNCMIVAMRYTKDRDSAQDILSDAFIKIFNNLHTFNMTGSLEGWMKRIVFTTAIDSIRKNKKTLVMDSDDMTNFDELREEDEAFEFEEAEDIRDLPTNEVLEEIQNLSPGYRAVFNMFVFENMTHKEIAEQLGIAEGTSKSNLAKARMILRERIMERVLKNKNLQNKRQEAYRLADVSVS
ncbi:MAG: sigma-70 family RNA polymerase sigma factor [Nanoarchaeota archaeon]